MKIIFDIRKIDDYGIGTYIKNIFGGLIKSGNFDYKIISLKGKIRDISDTKNTIEVNSKNYTITEHFEIPSKIKNLNDYYYFSPHYVFPYFIKNRFFITIHDIIHFKFSKLFPFYKVELAKLFIKKAKREAEIIFTVSNTTKKDLINYFGFREEKIKVIYNGIDEIFFKMEKKDNKTDFPYILYIGNTTPHKNLKTLLYSFLIFSKRVRDIKLMLVGIRDKREILNFIKKYKLENRIIIKSFLSFSELIPVIDNSLFFVFPSLYEGFGLPPLEVMARGKAVISSTGGSLPEVLGDNALFFSPYSEEELSDKMYLLAENPELRIDFEKKALNHSKKFKWDKFIETYVKILEDYN